MLTEIVQHRDRFFQDHAQIRRVVYFNLNARDTGVDHPWTGNCGGTRAKIDRDYHTVDDPDDFDDSDRRDPDLTNPLGLEVTSLNLEDLKDLGSILRPRDIVVLDDLLQLTEEVQFLLKYGVHHLKLYLFVVTQTCLSSPLYSLIPARRSNILPVLRHQSLPEGHFCHLGETAGHGRAQTQLCGELPAPLERLGPLASPVPV